MNRFVAFFNALRTGVELADPATWKVRQNLVNALVKFLGAVAILLPLVGVHIDISSEDIVSLAGGIAVIVGLFNIYTTTATTKKIGLPSKPPADGRSESDNLSKLHDVLRGD